MALGVRKDCQDLREWQHDNATRGFSPLAMNNGGSSLTNSDCWFHKTLTINALHELSVSVKTCVSVPRWQGRPHIPQDEVSLAMLEPVSGPVLATAAVTEFGRSS